MGKLGKGLAAAGVIGAGLAGARWFGRAQERAAAPADNPRAFARAVRPAEAVAVVVCAGDSLTHGVASANYVDRLRWTFGGRGWAFVNGGINGNLAWNVGRRLDEIIACQPDAVTLLVGTNDINATLGGQILRNYQRQQGLREEPTLAWYRANVERIIDRLQVETGAAIAVLSLPMMGEDLGSEINGRVGEYNAALREIAAAKGVAYLPLHETLAAALPAGANPPAYRGQAMPMFKAIFQHLVLRAPWDAISAANGMTFLTDNLHLNDRGAAIIADLIGDFLLQELPDSLSAGG